MSKTIRAATIQRETFKRIGPRLQALRAFALPTDAEGVFGALLTKLDAAAARNAEARATEAARLGPHRSEATT